MAPPRELVLASPDLILNSKSRISWDTLSTYFECLGPKQILVENRRTRYSILILKYSKLVNIRTIFCFVWVRLTTKNVRKLRKNFSHSEIQGCGDQGNQSRFLLCKKRSIVSILRNHSTNIIESNNCYCQTPCMSQLSQLANNFWQKTTSHWRTFWLVRKQNDHEKSLKHLKST